ncbi:hypothetical protein [Occallatibacter savannae]|uniref:hypothetical protein n=1 Tax=Occallatibacter savannae TaxID=1002691 RepID=UPI000D6A0284|nr:hypothetical protein [Occallatibacter savannae]
MDVGAVERTRPVEQVGMRRGPADVAPALGVEASGRMEEDSYRNNGQTPDRGMDDPPEDAEPEQAEPPLAARGKTRVSLFA